MVGGIRHERRDDLRSERTQVDPLGDLVDVLELRREQQVGDDVGHGLGVVDELVDLGQPTRGRRVTARRLGRGHVERDVAAQHLGAGADDGERGAQLVRGVGDELPLQLHRLTERTHGAAPGEQARQRGEQHPDDARRRPST